MANRDIDKELVCSEPDCAESIKPHAWGRIKSADAGWFHQKDGKSFCLKHNPPWVAEWRANKARYKK